MRKIILICSLLISMVGFGQSVVQRASPANTVDDPNGMNSRSKIIPRYQDTTQANTLYSTLDSAGKIIYTRGDKSFWYRQDNPKKWVKVVSGNNLSGDFFYDTTCNCFKIDTTALINIINNYNVDSSITSISILNDSTVRICYSSGSCINVGFVTNITNINTVYFVGGDSIGVCKIDTAGGVVTTICDTVAIGIRPNTTIFQNGLVLSNNISEFGSNPLIHNTTLNTGYYKQFFIGNSIYDAPYQFEQRQEFFNSTGVASFLDKADYNNNGTVHLLSNRLVVNYTGDAYLRSPSYVKGYFGDSSRGYFINTNGVGYGGYGWRQDDVTAKTTGIFFHTQDTSMNWGVTIFAVPRVASTGNNLMGGTGNLGDYKVAEFNTDKSLQFYGYNNTSSFISTDSAAIKPLGVDVDGNVYRMANWFGGGGVTTIDNNLSVSSNVIATRKTFKTITSSGGNATFDAATGFNGLITLTENVLLSVSNLQDGDYGTIQITQGGSGSYTFSVPTIGQLSVRSAIGSVTNVYYVYNGSSLSWKTDYDPTDYVIGSRLADSVDNRLTSVYRKTGTDSVFQCVNGSCTFAYIDTAGASATLTQYYVGVGDASNLLSGSSNFTFNASSGLMKINGSDLVLRTSATDTWDINWGSSIYQLYNYAAGKYLVSVDADGRTVIDPTTAVTDGANGKALEIKRGAVYTHFLDLGADANSDAYVRFRNTTGTGGQINYNGSADLEITTNGSEHMRIFSTGKLKLNSYTSTSAFTGTPIGYLQFDASGNILTAALPSASITADNGLTASTSTNVQLGGTLLGNTTINTSTFYLKVTGNPSNNGSIYGESTGSQAAIFANNSGSGHAIHAISKGAAPIRGERDDAGTNTVTESVLLWALSQGTAANGFGTKILTQLEAADGSIYTANELITKWTDATAKTSQFSITGLDAGTTRTLMTADGNGGIVMAGAGSPSTTLLVENTTNEGLEIQTTTGTGIATVVQGGLAANFFILPSSTNTVASVINISRGSSGTAADGIGGSIDFYNKTSGTGAGQPLSNQVISKWTTDDNATRISQFKVTGVLSASTVDLLTLNGDGSMQLRPITATAASAITPAEGMIVFVSSTNGTFTSIGFWGYQNAAWHAF